MAEYTIVLTEEFEAVLSGLGFAIDRCCYEHEWKPLETLVDKLKGQITPRTPKERGADKQKITCLNCKHLMFSDMYGECNKQLRIVNPGDTCEFAEPKERGGNQYQMN